LHAAAAAVVFAEGPLQPCILDVVKTQGLVELSLLPELLNMQQPAAAAAAGSSKKASKRAAAEEQGDQQQQQQLAVGQEVQAMVQFIKDHYAVVSIVQQQQQQQKKAKKDAAGSTDASKQQQQYSHHGIAFIARGDVNSQGPAGKEARRFVRHQVVAAKVAALPSAGNGGRLLLEVRHVCCFSVFSLVCVYMSGVWG
jgi:hypothetical protein